MERFNVISAVETYLKANGFLAPMQTDSKTDFWSFLIASKRMTGFLSIHQMDHDVALSASLTIGLINPARKAEAIKLLEQNNALNNGLALASQMESLVVVQFSESIELLTVPRLQFRLGQLQIEAAELRVKFVERERLLEPLPACWFEQN